MSMAAFSPILDSSTFRLRFEALGGGQHAVPAASSPLFPAFPGPSYHCPRARAVVCLFERQHTISDNAAGVAAPRALPAFDIGGGVKSFGFLVARNLAVDRQLDVQNLTTGTTAGGDPRQPDRHHTRIAHQTPSCSSCGRSFDINLKLLAIPLRMSEQVLLPQSCECLDRSSGPAPAVGLAISLL